MSGNRSKLVTRGFSGMTNSILELELPGGARGGPAGGGGWLIGGEIAACLEIAPNSLLGGFRG